MSWPWCGDGHPHAWATTRRIAGHDDAVAEPVDAAGHENAVPAAAAARGELVAFFFRFFYLSPVMVLSCFLFSVFFFIL
jgi:hypothetical protein